MEGALGTLDFVYVPTADVDAAAAHYVEALGAQLRWKVRGMGTTVACVRVNKAGPDVLLSGHLEGSVPILVFRVTTTTPAPVACAPMASRCTSWRSRTAPARASPRPVGSALPSTS